MSNNSTRYRQGFFAGDGVTKNQNSKVLLLPVDVGGEGDCGFRAVAAGLLDHVLSSPRSHDAVLKKILQSYFQYYPNYKPQGAFLTAKDRLEMLSRNVHMPELVTTMAYVLRQMAVDTMLENPSLYRGAFVRKNETTSPEQMRKQSTWIDETAMAALANTLDISISVSVLGTQRELPLCLIYNKSEKPKTEKPLISVMLTGQHYIPKVKNPARFQPLSQRKARAIEPALVQHVEPTMDELLKRIEREDQRMLNHFNLTKKRIRSAVDAGELSQGELLDLYIAGMSSSDYLQGRVKQIGLELGSENYFNQLIARYGQHSEQHHGAAVIVNHGDRMTQELIHALARAVCIGQMSEDMLFTSVEEHRNAFK